MSKRSLSPASDCALRSATFLQRKSFQDFRSDGLDHFRYDCVAKLAICLRVGDNDLFFREAHQARGVTRLIPTTQPYMVQALWPELIDGPLPQTSVIWEATRFGCDRDLDSSMRRRVVAELICGCQEFGIANGISRYLGVMPLGIFHQVIAAAGCRVTQLGPARRMQQHRIAAAYIDVSSTILATVQRRGGINAPVLYPNLALAA